MTEEQLSALLRLKRHEQPPAGYFDELLRSVHRRQRQELLHRPLWKIVADRVRTFLAEPQLGPLAYGGAFATVMTIGVLAINSTVPAGSGTLAEARPPLPTVGSWQLAKSAPRYALRLQPGAEAIPLEPEQHFLTQPEQMTLTPRYVIDARPVSYDSMPSF